MSSTSDNDDTVEIPTLREQVLADTREIATGGKLLDEFNALNAQERAWVVWAKSLSEADMKIVELCAERGITVTPATFEQMKTIVKDHYAKGSGSDE